MLYYYVYTLYSIDHNVFKVFQNKAVGAKNSLVLHWNSTCQSQITRKIPIGWKIRVLNVIKTKCLGYSSNAPDKYWELQKRLSSINFNYYCNTCHQEFFLFNKTIIQLLKLITILKS